MLCMISGKNLNHEKGELMSWYLSILNFPMDDELDFLSNWKKGIVWVRYRNWKRKENIQSSVTYRVCFWKERKPAGIQVLNLNKCNNGKTCDSDLNEIWWRYVCKEHSHSFLESTFQLPTQQKEEAGTTYSQHLLDSVISPDRANRRNTRRVVVVVEVPDLVPNHPWNPKW